MQYTAFQNTRSFLQSSTPSDPIERWERFKECLREDAKEAARSRIESEKRGRQRRQQFANSMARATEGYRSFAAEMKEKIQQLEQKVVKLEAELQTLR